jgi:hypothetical protein
LTGAGCLCWPDQGARCVQQIIGHVEVQPLPDQGFKRGAFAPLAGVRYDRQDALQQILDSVRRGAESVPLIPECQSRASSNSEPWMARQLSWGRVTAIMCPLVECPAKILPRIVLRKRYKIT